MGVKRYYAILFAIVWGILLLYFLQARRRKDKISKILTGLLGIGLLSVTSYLFVLTFNNYLIISMAYSVYFVCIDAMLYCLLAYMWLIVCPDKNIAIPSRLLLSVLALDSISMLCNPFFEHALTYMRAPIDNDLYLVFQPKLPYELHLCLSYIMCVVFFGSLLYKIHVTPKLYRKRYIKLFAVLAVIIAMNAMFMALHKRIDFSILVYALAGVLLYNYTFSDDSRQLFNQIMNFVFDKSVDACIAFDPDGLKLMQNEKANSLFGDVFDLEETIKKLDIPVDKQGNDVMPLGRIIHTRGNKQLTLSGQYKNLRDEKGRYLGCVIKLHDMTEEIQNRENQEFLMTHDTFTGLYNKSYFYQRVKAMLMQNPDERYCMICSNISKFKLINDTYGVETGNWVLLKVADIIRSTPLENCVYGRMESDKFAICMHMDDFAEEELQKCSEFSFEIEGTMIPVQNFFGVYEIEDNEGSVDLMCDRAIMALSTIKGNYQKHVAYYQQEFRLSMLHDHEIICGLQDGLDREEFEIYLQPQFNHKNGEIVGTEALVRWRHPEKGLIMPGEFVPILEEQGVISKLDLYVWERVCRLLQKWKKEGKPTMSISVNLSARDLEVLDIYNIFVNLTWRYEVDPRNLRIELTESALMQDVPKAVELLHKLQDKGFVIEIDDFGCGYSSLNTLKDIPADVLKLDMAFLSNGENQERSSNIMEMVVGLGSKLNMPVIAEGVENLEQADFLQGIGCNIIQGYYYAKPMAVEEFEELLAGKEYQDLFTEESEQ
ncbi:MAG: EAL domain-containing protein [Lachnospiraceae bacterium]|nr:EAL domain-containing protein [Lachnospiraceae bacterium]